MASDLKEYLQIHKGGNFNPVPHYFASGDYVTYYFRNERCYAQRVDDLLTVYLSLDNHELVGCKIKGVKHILKTAGTFGVQVDCGQVSMGFLFYFGVAGAKDEKQKQRYEELNNVAKDAVFDGSQAMCA
jgi:hypothetical protein